MKRILISNFPGRTGQFLILVIFIAIFAFSSQAQILNDDLSQGPATNIDATGLVQLLGGIACWLLRFAIIAVSIAMIFYGILFLKGRGSPQGMTYAKKALTWGLVGGLIIFGVFTIILSVAGIIWVSYPILSIVNC